MKTIYSIILFLTLIQQVLIAQTTLKGSLKDPTGKALAFVSVGLLKPDSALVKATASDEQGHFLFEKVEAGKYLLTASAIGFQKKTSAIFEVKNELIEMPDLVLIESPTQLKEVQVATKRAFVEQLLDRTVVNVANSIVSSGSTALEVLTKAPGVTVDFQNDVIQLRGKEGVLVQIDGKQTYLSGADVVGMLKGMPSDNIDKIEIITNPSAKYDAAGNSGIINIRLKKNTNFGTNGLFTLGVGTGQHFRGRTGLQLNHRTEKFNFFGNYNLSKTGNFFDLTLYREQPDGNLTNYVNQHTHLVFNDIAHNAKAGVDYSPTKNTTMGVVWTGIWGNRSEKGPANFTAQHSLSQPIYMDIETDKKIMQPSQNHLFNFNFQHNFKNKSALTADVDVGHFEKDFTNSLNSTAVLLTPSATPPIPKVINNLLTSIDIKTWKVDYNLAISKLWKLEAGVKQAHINTENELTLKSGDSNQITLDPTQSSHFTYQELVNAAYTILSGKIGKADVQAGLRAEHTHSVGNLSSPSQNNTRDYLNWFPSLFVSKPISEKQTLIFSYSYRIDRPNYQNINPAKNFVDLYSYTQGNIELKPQYTHALELRYALKNGFSASMTANYVSDFISTMNYVIENNKLQRISQNFGNSQGYVLTMAMPFTLSKAWQMQATLMGYYTQLQYRYEGKDWNIKNVSSRLNINNGFTLGRGWTAELNGWVNSPGRTSVWETPWMSNVDVGIQKAVSQKMKLKASLQNMFNTFLVSNVLHGANSYQTALLWMDTRVAMLNLTYAFGNQKVKAARQRRSGSEDESRRTN